jgi:hypothetical protein
LSFRSPGDDVPVDPLVSEGFWSKTPKAMRSKADLAWWGRPFIQTVANPHFPSGIRYDVYCLEAGATLDRPAVWGMFGTLEEALRRAQDGPPWCQEAPEGVVDPPDGGW